MATATRQADLPTVQDVTRVLTQVVCNAHGTTNNTVKAIGIKLGARPPTGAPEPRRWLCSRS